MADQDKPSRNPKTSPASDDAGQAEVAEKMAVEQEQGYRGVKTDPTPDAAYTVAGVTSGQPTPETDPEQAAKAEAHVDQLGTELGDPAEQRAEGQ